MKSKATFILSTIVLIILILLVGGLLFLKSDFAANRMRDTLQEVLQEGLGVKVSIGSCSVDLLPPTVLVRKMAIQGKNEQRLLEVEQLRVELDSLALLAGRFQIDRLQVEKPRIFLVMENGSLINLPELPKSESESADQEQSSMLLHRLEVENAEVNFIWDQIGQVRLRELWATLLIKNDDQMELLAEVAKASLQVPEASQELPSVEALRIKASLARRVFVLEHVSFQVGELDALARGKVHLTPDGPKPEIVLNIKSPMGMLNSFLPTVPKMEGSAVIEAKVSVVDQVPRCTGTVEVKKYGIEHARNIRFRTKFDVDSEMLSLRDLIAVSQAGTVTGTAQLVLRDALEFKGALRLKGVDLGNALLMANIAFSPVALRGDGEVSFSGKFRAKPGAFVSPRLRLQLSELAVSLAKDQAPVFSKKLGRARAEATFTGRQVRIPSFKLELEESILEGQGEISFVDGAVIGKLGSSSLKLKDISPLAGLVLAGECSFTFNASQRLFEPKLEILFEVDGLELDDRYIGALRGNLVFVDDQLLLKRMLVARHGGVVRLLGKLDARPPHALQGAVILDGASLPEVFAVVQGSREPDFLQGQLIGRMEASGTLESLRLSFKLAFNDVLVGSQVFEEGGVIGRFSEGAWHFELVEARMGPGWLFAQGEISEDLLLNLRAYSTGLRASSFQWLSGLKGLLDFRLDLQLSVKGPVRSPSFSGWTKIYDTHLKEQKLHDSFVSAQVTTESFKVEGHFLGEASRLYAKVRLESDLPFVTGLTFNLDRLGSYLGVVYPDLKSEAELVGSVEARGRLLKPSSVLGELRIEKLHVTASDLSLQNNGPLVAMIKNGGFELQQFELVGSNTALSLSGGGLFIDQPARSKPKSRTGPKLEVEGMVSLDGFPPFFDFLSRSVGRSTVKLTVGGSWSSPTFSGEARFSIDQLRFVGFGQDFQEVSGMLKLKPGLLRFNNVRGRIGGGRFVGDGQVKLDGFSPQNATMDFEAEQVRYYVMENLWGVATGSLGLTWKLGELWILAGDVRVHEGEFRERVRLVPVGDDIFRRRITKARTYDVEREVLALDLQVRVPSRFRVSYNLDLIDFKAEMQGNLRVTGTNERLGLLGELEALSGTVAYLSSDFRLDSAQVRFVEEFSVHPQVDVLASLLKTVDRGERGDERGGKTDYRIELHFNSDGENIRPVELKSDPWLERHDIVAILHFGFTTQDIEVFKGKDLWEPILRYIEPTTDALLRRMFPFPPEVIQPTHLRVRSRILSSGQLGSVSPRVEIGAKLNIISDDLIVGYGRSLYNELDQSLELTYNLSESVSTRLRWDDAQRQNTPADIGDLGLDLRLHWEW